MWSGCKAEYVENQVHCTGTIPELNATDNQSLNTGSIGVWQQGTYFIGSPGLLSGKE